MVPPHAPPQLVQYRIQWQHRTSKASLLNDLMRPVNPVCTQLMRLGSYVCAWGHRLGERLHYCNNSREQATSYDSRRFSLGKECSVWARAPGETSSMWLEEVMSLCVEKTQPNQVRAAASSIRSTHKFQLFIPHFTILLSPFMPCCG